MPFLPEGGVQEHATCVNIGGCGVLLLGPSGSGKSDLALRLIDSGASLVADDRVNLVVKSGQLLASPPAPIAGKIEAYGIGILELPHTQEVAVSIAVDVTPQKTIERLPEPVFFDCLGVRLPLVSLNAFEGSVCAKIRLYLQAHNQ
jgi:serine kinase of HPr protein (carbohydrate metabolism regulator)